MRGGGAIAGVGHGAGEREKGLRQGDGGLGPGSLAVVGIGPGGPGDLTFRAVEALKAAEVVVGYRLYLNLITHLLDNGQEVVRGGMTREVERCRQALDLAASGRRVVLVSSGDPGVYGMAGLVLELRGTSEAYTGVEVEVVPGVTAASAAASLLGAPLMHDFAVISLSDLLTPWKVILQRVKLAAASDFVLALYNPSSHKRRLQVLEAQNAVLQYRSGSTPVGVVWNAGREGERVDISSLEAFTNLPLDMTSLVIIGNSQTRVEGGWMITPRGYRLERGWGD